MMQNRGQLYVTQKTLNRLNIPYSEQIDVRVGVKTVPAQLVVRDNLPAGYRLSDDLALALCLHNRSNLRLRYDREDHSIHLGPLIGVLIDFLPNKEEYDPKSVQAELVYLSSIGKRLPAQYFIFTPGCINWSNHTVRGYVWHNGGIGRGWWSSSAFPLPDVVYDRISTRVAQTRCKSTRQRLMNLPHLHYFNPSFLNKWRVHQLLAANEQLNRYLPETQVLNLANLTAMANKYQVLYLKPSNGSLGSRIIKVTSGEHNWHYTIYSHGRHSGQASSPAGFLKATRTTRGKRSYIVQQGLDLDTYCGNPFDMRIIFQKDGEGKWQISKKFARVAPRGSSIANLSRGGTAETSHRIMVRIFKGNRQIIKEKNRELKELCLMVAETLETNSQKNYGELGLDIGIDKAGRLWIIEVNSKPRKTTVTNLSQEIVRNTFRRPLQYAIHLAGFKKTK